MLKNLQELYDRLEGERRILVRDLEVCTDTQMKWQPAPERWSMLMAVKHIVGGEKGMLQSFDELRQNPVRTMLQPGKMFEMVMDVLEKDVPVGVPHPSLEPDNRGDLKSLTVEWEQVRAALRTILEAVDAHEVDAVMFSHPAAGPLDPVRNLQLALAHFATHRRQIDRIRNELAAMG